MKRIILIIISLAPIFLWSQIGGRSPFDFMRMSASGRVVAMGGENVSIMDDDIHLGWHNPALVNDSMHGRLGLSVSNYLGDLTLGYAGYSRTSDKLGSWHAGIHYLSAGQFDGYDALGNPQTGYNAGEYALVVGLSRPIGPFRYGANLKYMWATLASGYSSATSALAVDVGASYQSKSKLFMAGMVIKNSGLIVSSPIVTGEQEGLPLELQVGFSNKLRYMPLRFSVTFTNLEHPNLIYEDPNAPPRFDLNGQIIEEPDPFLDNLVRHVVFGGEFLLGKSLRVRGGYRHLRRQELKALNRNGLAGFSLGFGLRVGRLAFDYGYSAFGVSNTFNTHQFSLLMSLGKKKVKS
ncbi:MAG: type IX secretion system protein PorQ [Bacteroidia bacterium]